MLALLTRAIETRDPYTRGHSLRVTALAEGVARRLGWSEERLAALRLGGALHDVGKLSVARGVLEKAGPLSADELALVRRHPAVGAELLAKIPEARPALPYVLHHHERWDGGGYPSGCAGTQFDPVLAGAFLTVWGATARVTPTRRASSASA